MTYTWTKQMTENSHEKCPACKQTKHVLEMKTVNGHRMCTECMYDYGDYMMEMKRHEELENDY